MKYEKNDIVVLKNRHDVIGHSNAVKIEHVSYARDKYYSERVINGGFDDKDIDDEKTAEYNKKNNDLRDKLKRVLKGKESWETVENVIQPNHYQKNGMDLIDNFKNLFDEKEFRAVMKSNIFRYVVRYEEKNGIQDLFKAIEFAERLIEWEELEE